MNIHGLFYTMLKLKLLKLNNKSEYRAKDFTFDGDITDFCNYCKEHSLPVKQITEGTIAVGLTHEDLRKHEEMR